MCLRWCLQMSAALRLLHGHEPPIYHRDFKSLNVLVTADWACKLADFGLSRQNSAENQQTLSETRGTAHYAAPEVLMPRQFPFNDRSDVYRFNASLTPVLA